MLWRMRVRKFQVQSRHFTWTDSEQENEKQGAIELNCDRKGGKANSKGL